MVFSLKLIRRFSNSTCSMSRRLTRRSNPGLGYQLNDIEDAAEVIQSDPEGFGGLESDLFNAHKTYKEHQLDLSRQRDKIRQYIIKNKYFRSNSLPNLLTYAEKEHIRHLHSTDGEEWTVEKLAESFPASSDTVRKILKSRWSPLSPKRILAHDANVSKNWETFKNGGYKTTLSSDMCEHLAKFADRSSNNLQISHDVTNFVKKQWQRPISHEFSSIISSLQSRRNDTTELNSLNCPKPKVKGISANSLESETYLLGEISNKKPITIHELKTKQFFKTTEDSIDNNLDELAAQEMENITGTGILKDNKKSSKSNLTADYTDKFILNEVVISESDRKRYAMAPTKPRIYIPRKLWRKGATYRANDCYYDDDGEFLYKVPAWK